MNLSCSQDLTLPYPSCPVDDSSSREEDYCVMPVDEAAGIIKEFSPRQQFLSVTKGTGSMTMELRLLFRQARDFGLIGKYRISTVKGKDYIIFTGNARLRRLLKGTRYAANNIKVLNLGIGKAVAAKGLKRAGPVGIVFVICWDVVEYLMSDTLSFIDLGVGVSTDLVKAVLSSATGAVGAYAVGALTGVVIAPLAAGIVIAIGVGVGLDYLDSKFGITEAIRGWANNQWKEAERRAREIESEINGGMVFAGDVVRGVADGYIVVVTTFEAIYEWKRTFDQFRRFLPRF